MAQTNAQESRPKEITRKELDSESNDDNDDTNESNDGKNLPYSTIKSKNENKRYTPKHLKPTIIYNYSSIELNEQMNKLLNRGLNFAILPLKLDITQVLVDFKRFERSTIWHEFWYRR